MRNPRGFTLIELMIVVVIIGVLAAIAIPKFTQVSLGAKQAEADPILKEILTLEERYWAREGAYTTVLDDLEGGTELQNRGTYFTYSVAEHTSGVCVTATPSAVGTQAGVSARSLDTAGNFYDSANCS